MENKNENEENENEEKSMRNFYLWTVKQNKSNKYNFKCTTTTEKEDMSQLKHKIWTYIISYKLFSSDKINDFYLLKQVFNNHSNNIFSYLTGYNNNIHVLDQIKLMNIAETKSINDYTTLLYKNMCKLENINHCGCCGPIRTYTRHFISIIKCEKCYCCFTHFERYHRRMSKNVNIKIMDCCNCMV
jgi:hypothetical protein